VIAAAAPPVAIEERVCEHFERDARDHRMTVLRDDGVYRHLRFKRPGTGFYYYDLITWPGNLVITGDGGRACHFARLHDMFDFFDHEGRINPYYWSEKLQGQCRRDVQEFDHDLYVRLVEEWFRDQTDELDDDEVQALRSAVDEQLLNEWTAPTDVDSALTLLRDFEHPGVGFSDVWEYADALRDWNHHYVWSCWAIVQGVAQYRWAKGWR
jgi:hypothetical protein